MSTSEPTADGGKCRKICNHALRELSTCFDIKPVPGKLDGDRFEMLLTLVGAHEAKHYPIDLPEPVEAIKFHMEQAGRKISYSLSVG